MTRLFRMRFKDALTTIFLASFTIFWLAFSFRQVWVGYIVYGGRLSSRRTFTAEEHPVAFYTLLAINIACVLVGVFLTFSHIRSVLLDARFREEDQRAAAKRKAERRERQRKVRTMTDEQKTSLVRRARKKQLDESRARSDRRKSDNPEA